MVRYKARYLLFNILYPNGSTSTKPVSTPTTSSSTAAPAGLDFLLPTPDVTPGEFSRLLRDTIAAQFGDFDAGVTGSLSSIPLPLYYSYAWLE